MCSSVVTETMLSRTAHRLFEPADVERKVLNYFAERQACARPRYAVGDMTMFTKDQERERAVECAACGHQRGVHGESEKLCMGTAHAGEHAHISERCGCQEFVEPGQSQAPSANP